MKKILPIVVIGILVLSGLGAVALPDQDIKVESITVSFSQPKIQNENQFITVNIDETNTFIMNQNKPLLPSYIQTFTYPFGTEIKSVNCIPSNIQQKTLTKDIIPTPEAFSVCYETGIKKTHSSNEYYGNDPYPNTWFTYDVGCGLVGNERNVIVKVEVYPVQYFPAESRIEWSNDVDIFVEYEVPLQTAESRDQYSLIILTPPEYESQLNNLVTHKESRGISTKLVMLDDIYAGIYFPSTGRDDQEKIKYFIYNAIENWYTEYVLLVGGIDKFPAREAHIYFRDGDDNETFMSELYYADIYNESGAFCSWDSNGNDVFAEYDWGPSRNYDEMDLYPDIKLGRLACASSTELTTCINKIKTYEEIGNEAYTQHWFNDLVVIGGDHAGGDPGAVDEGEYVNQKIIDIMAGFVPNRLWASEGDLTGYLPNGAKKISNAINLGCGFVDFSGHGSPLSWATHPHENNSVWIPTAWPYSHGYISTVHIVDLTNGDELPIIIIGACSTCKYNLYPDCFGWMWLKNTDGGGIGAIGAAALDWFYYGTYVAEKGFEKICIDAFQSYADGANTFGAIWSGAVYRSMRPSMDGIDVKTLVEFQPFGDPSLAIRGDSQAPAKPSTPEGETEGGIRRIYYYTTSTTDPEGDDVYYLFDWGDGTFSNWKGPFPSGFIGDASHKWTKMGDYEIRVIAKDENGVIGTWSDPLVVTMPRGIMAQGAFLMRLLEQYPNAFPIIRELLGL